MSVRTRLNFTDERAAALDAMTSISSGRGWCNVVADVDDDVPDLKVNVLGLWINRGAAVATLVTSPARDGAPQPSTLGVLHSRGRLGRERIATLVGDMSCSVLQDHNQRGLLLSVDPETSLTKVLDVMCIMSMSLCDFDTNGGWRLDLFVRA